MNQNTHIYIILNFLLLILFIDIYVTYSVKNSLNENFTIFDVSGDKLICLINNLCKLGSSQTILNLNPTDVLNIINCLIVEYADLIENTFRKIDPTIDLTDVPKIYEKNKSKFNNMYENINNIKEYSTINDNIANDTDLNEYEIINNAQNNLNIINEVNSEKKIMIFNLFEELYQNKNSCQNINKFLVIFYIENYSNKTTSIQDNIEDEDNNDLKDNDDIEDEDDNVNDEKMYKKSFLSVIQTLTDVDDDVCNNLTKSCFNI